MNPEYVASVLDVDVWYTTLIVLSVVTSVANNPSAEKLFMIFVLFVFLCALLKYVALVFLDGFF